MTRHRGQHGDASPGEEDTRQEVEDAGHQGAHEHARQPPAERVAVDADPCQASVRRQGQEFAAVAVGVLRLRVGKQDGRLCGQRHVCEHGVAVRLDDVDGGSAGRGITEDVDQVGRLVPGHPADGGRHRQLVRQPGSALQQRHDLQAVAGGGVERRLIEAVLDERQRGDRVLGGHVGDEVQRPGVQDGDAAVVRHCQQGRRLDARPLQAALVDGLLDTLQRLFVEVGVCDHDALGLEESLEAIYLAGRSRLRRRWRRSPRSTGLVRAIEGASQTPGGLRRVRELAGIDDDTLLPGQRQGV